MPETSGNLHWEDTSVNEAISKATVVLLERLVLFDRTP
jgi:hypothetical protein